MADSLIGQQFGRWIVEAEATPDNRGRMRYRSRCSCGHSRDISIRVLERGWITSCDCRRVEASRKSRTIHGRADTPEFNIWVGAKIRCNSQDSADYRLYGGRGISMCERWLNSFANFFADMGPRPTPQHSLDRIDPNLGYEPSNCRWATQQVQQNNRRGVRLISAFGETKTIAQWAREQGLPYERLYTRITLYGWSPEKALTEPVWGSMKRERKETLDPYPLLKEAAQHVLPEERWEQSDVPRFQQNKGRRFGRLVVLSLAPERYKWRCVCDCGRVTDVRHYSLFSGNTTTCGCGKIKAAIVRNHKHGMAPRGDRCSEYEIWTGIKRRTTNPNCRDFANYGGRGVRVCERWLASFEAFMADMGSRPSPKHSLDRINVDGDYEPGNCRWASRDEQARNKRSNRLLTAFGVTKTLVEWAEGAGLTLNQLRKRVAVHGWSLERAVTEPLNTRRRVDKKAA